SIDWSLDDGLAEIPIEERSATEVTGVVGRSATGGQTVDIAPPGAKAANFAFDVTPRRLVTALVTDRGVCPASREGLISRFPERSS
ncbi:MAG: S-methyl-5-thioribose-1-phosphate isomerase, partial [Acidobacteriota bacterium]